jgi:hypothetical protein
MQSNIIAMKDLFCASVFGGMIKRSTVIAMLCVLLTTLLLCAFAHAQTTSLPRYDIGSIPDQAAWHDSTRSFFVHWDDQASVSFTLEADPPPSGQLLFEPFAPSESDWLFSFTPDASDKTAFTVTLVATLGAQEKMQSFVITPQPNLPPEQTVFGMQDHEPPVITTFETKVFDWESPVAESFNYQSIKTNRVQIIGEIVVIEAGHANGLYEAYFDGSRLDIKEMEIIGETVTIRSPARLKQTDVTIYARYVRFEDDGQLKTTPEEITTTPGLSANGVDGLKAGDVTLNVSFLYYDAPGLKFDLTGGKGQPGGPGQHGTDGADISLYWTSFKCEYYLDNATYYAPAGEYITYAECGGGHGTTMWPGNGTNAKPSGKPGEGGTAGNLRSIQDFAGFFSTAGGQSGPANYPTTWPTTYYKGGYAGWPTKAVHVDFYWDTWCACVGYSTSKHTSTAGANAAVALPSTTAGLPGNYDVSGSLYAWLHPLMLRKVLNHVREDYLGENLSVAEARLADYVTVLDDFKADSSWDALDPEIRFELEQMYDERQILLQQIANNLDYFGNPAGWVPMLSFEVNYAIFSQEIDRAIRMLYLAYWIRTKETTEALKAEALVTARDQLKEEIAQAKVDYDDAVSRIPLIKSKAENLKVEILETRSQLEVRENELIQQTRDPVWLAVLKGGLKGAAMACQMIPVYQPALGAVGDGLRLMSDIDPDKPWDSILGAADIASTFLESDFDTAANNQKTAKDGINTDDIESKGFDYLGALRTASAGLSKGLADIKGFIDENKAGSPDMMAELERLKSNDPKYQELVQKIEELMLKNRGFADELINTMQQIATLSNLLNRNILAIDAMNREAAPGLLVADGRASSYLDDMEQRTYNRLLKYHYYLAKAFEYRLLRPYEGTLNLEGLLDRFQQVAAANSDHLISAAEFESFKAVYEEKLSLVAEQIYDEYNANRPELNTDLPFALTDDEIAGLNNDETVTLNLMHKGFFFPDEENVRIVDLGVYGIETEPIGGSYGTFPMVRLKIEHFGLSNYKTDGYIYQFRHYNSETENPIIWEARYFPDIDELIETKPSFASQSLLCTLLESYDCESLMLYSRPSAWADLRVSRDCRDKTCETINILSVILKLDFDFMPRNESLARKDLEVLVTKTVSDGQDMAESGFLPYFIVSRPDFNFRQDARGRFLRIYEYSGSWPVEITAQPKYGTWAFSKWTTRTGSDLPGGPFENPMISLLPSDDQVIAAQYMQVGLCDADFDLDGDVDGNDLANFHQNEVSLSTMALEFGRNDCMP